jgi:hypothetical protein
MIEKGAKAPQYNGHWTYWLPRILTDARMKGAILGETAGLQAVAAEQVQAYFHDHIVNRASVEVVAKGRWENVGNGSLIGRKHVITKGQLETSRRVGCLRGHRAVVHLCCAHWGA